MFYLHQYSKDTEDYVLHIDRYRQSITGWIVGKYFPINELIVRYQYGEEKIPLDKERLDVVGSLNYLSVDPYCGFSFTPQKKENFTLCLQRNHSVIEIATIAYFKEKTNNRPIIFIHIPKTAGTSFKNAANEIELRTLYDYGETNPDTSDIIKNSIYANDRRSLFEYVMANEIQFLGGHEISDYFSMFNEVGLFCTFFREPIQRVISEYQHVVKHYGYPHSIEIFCTDPIYCNRQSQFINDLDLESFFFFGLTEEYKASLSLFNTLTGLYFPYIETNMGREKCEDKWSIDQTIIELIKSQNQQDLLLYEKAKEMFYEKLSTKQPTLAHDISLI